ncbi:ankyrin repeat-containing domain protein [Aspergillus heterothallicus]
MTPEGIRMSELRLEAGAQPIRYPSHTSHYHTYQQRKARYEGLYRPGSVHERILNLLIAHGADLEICDRTGRSPLICAVANGAVGVAENLLSRGADVNAAGALPSALFHAAANGDSRMVQLLLAYKASTLPRQAGCPWSPLWIAARNGHFNVVETLLSYRIPTPSSPQREFRTWEPLLDAAKRGHARVVQILIAYHKQAWPGVPLGQQGLFWAAYGGWERVFHAFLDAGVPLGGLCRGIEAMPILSAAVMGRNTVIVNHILSKGVDVNARDGYKWSAMNWAVWTKNRELEDVLRTHGAEDNNRDWLAGGPWPHHPFQDCVPAIRVVR